MKHPTNKALIILPLLLFFSIFENSSQTLLYKDESKLFYNQDFSNPLNHSEDCLDAVRWAPSAANRQPWRIVKDDNDYHFFLEHTKGYSSGVEWDVQKIDMGIAICHFLCVKNGNLVFDEPEIETDEYTEHIATISCE